MPCWAPTADCLFNATAQIGELRYVRGFATDVDVTATIREQPILAFARDARAELLDALNL